MVSESTIEMIVTRTPAVTKSRSAIIPVQGKADRFSR